MDVIFDRGVYLPSLDLWLDSRRKRQVGYISHAHADHTAAHHRPILTRATSVLLRKLLRRSDPYELEYGESYETPYYSLTLYPAGHCLGAALALVRCKATGKRLLYTGDFRVNPSPTAEPLATVSCDVLIMESTFGRPEYVFPPQEEVLAGFFKSLRSRLQSGIAPVVLAYRMGKAQELLHHLLSQGFHVALEEGAYQVARSYEAAGVKFPGTFRSFDGNIRDGEVLVFPPGRGTKEALKDVKRKRFIGMSGWALHEFARHRLGADEVHPFSDHADFRELVEYVEAVTPKEVYTVYGFPDLASHLRAQGYNAQHLENGHGKGQLRLL